MARIPLSTLSGSVSSGQPRTKIVTFLESDPAYLIPEWCLGGKGMMYISGSGGGGGSSGSPASGGYGNPGGSAASAIRHLLPVLPAVTELSIVIGAAGLGGAVNAAGTGGGQSSVGYSSITAIQLGGGSAGAPTGTVGGGGGYAYLFGNFAAAYIPNNDLSSALTRQMLAQMLQSVDAAFGGNTLFNGNFGNSTSAAGHTFAGTLFNNDGTPSPFGGKELGYGFGGARCVTFNAPGKPGGAGFITIEFVEGF